MKAAKIKINRDLLNQCKAYSMSSGYSTVEEFITHVLEKELRKNQSQPVMDKDIEKQLKGLGYIE